MRRLLGLKSSANTSSSMKGKEPEAPEQFSLPDSSTPPGRSAMEVHVSTEVHSAPERSDRHPISSKTSLSSSSPASFDSRPLPPEIRVPTHPYPYWQGYTHTPSSSSSLSSLESPMTPSHVSWFSPGNVNAAGNPNAANIPPNNHTSLQHSAGPSLSSHSLIQVRSSPSPHFPPPPPNPPPSIVARPKLLHPTKSSHSLRVPVQEFFNQQLSPIVEQDYLSPEKRPLSLASLSHEGGTRSSTTHTARTSAALMTPVSPVSDGVWTAAVTPVSPVPITPVLVTARGAPPTPQALTHTPVMPSPVVPFAGIKEEEGNESPRPSPVSTFILRPLNRSISLSSTRTRQTSASSVTPPVIPPLDLKPEFKGQTFVTTPTSLHSRGLLDVAARDDDSVSDKRESFVTAQTGAGRESRYSLGQDEVFVDAEEGFRRDSDGTIQQFDSRLLEDSADILPTPLPEPIPQKPIKPPVPARTIMHLPSTSHSSSSPPSYNRPHSSDNHLHVDSYPHPHRHTPFTLHPSRSDMTAPSLQDLGISISMSSSFVDRRFAPSSLYLPPVSERESVRRAGSWWMHLERVDTIQVLFWFGFIAPWCWLIGGWLLTPRPPSRGHSSGSGYTSGYHHSLGGGGSSLPLWVNKSKSMQSFDTMRGYPFVAPSVSTPTPPPPPYQSQRAAVVWGKNPWVRRCRIAAVVSGALILVAFLVSLVVAATSHLA